MHFYRHRQTKLVTVFAIAIGRLPCHVSEVDVEHVAVGVWSGWNSSSFVLFLSLQHFPYGLFGCFYFFFLWAAFVFLKSLRSIAADLVPPLLVGTM